MLSGNFSYSYRVNYASLFFQNIVQILHLYNIIFAFVLYYNYLSYFLYSHSKLRSAIMLDLSWITLLMPSIQNILKKFVELIWISFSLINLLAFNRPFSNLSSSLNAFLKNILKNNIFWMTKNHMFILNGMECIEKPLEENANSLSIYLDMFPFWCIMSIHFFWAFICVWHIYVYVVHICIVYTHVYFEYMCTYINSWIYTKQCYTYFCNLL